MLKKATIYLLFALLSVACRNSPTGPDNAVNPLTEVEKKSFEQNIKSGLLPGPSSTKDPYKWPTTECTSFRNEVIPKNWIQDFIEVPENPEFPNENKIKIFYYGQIKKGSIPTVFFNGGPMQSSHSSLSSMVSNQRFFDQSNLTSFIFIDQRGTGCSDFYPQGNNPEIFERLKLYGSRGIISDAEMIRKKLFGEKKWNIFGQSYGAFIVHRYSILYPKSINAAFAHANTITKNGNERIKNRIKAQVRILGDYLIQYPEDKKKLEILKRKLGTNKCFYNKEMPNEKACGLIPLAELSRTLLGFSNQWAKIHQWIGVMVKKEQVDESEIGRFLSYFYFGESNPYNSTNNAGLVINWIDRNIPNYDYNLCSTMRTQLKKENIDLNNSLANECISILQKGDNLKNAKYGAINATNDLTQDLMTIEELKNAIEANPQMPFYIYAAMKDAYVPIENFDEEISHINHLSNVHYTIYKGSGHDEFLIEPQSWIDLIDHSIETN